MPAVVRLTDECTGHGCYPARPNAQGSPDTFVNGLAVHRVTDAWESHCCGPACHGAQQASGSPNWSVNGLAVARVGDDIDCGSANATGSPNTFVN